MSIAPEIPLSEHLRRIPPTVRPTVEAARQMVVAMAPKAREVTYQSQPPRSSRSLWKLVRYAVGASYVVGIGTYPTYVSLFFYRGRELDDKDGLLEGGGKDMRFIRLRGPADADRQAVKRLVRNAFRLGGV
jgi:hypothetical protein